MTTFCETTTGMAGDKQVTWLGNKNTAEEHEKSYEKASELLRLLLKNAYTVEGLNPDETTRAAELIQTLPENNKECWLCKTDKSIADTGLCRSHNFYALRTRK